MNEKEKDAIEEIQKRLDALTSTLETFSTGHTWQKVAAYHHAKAVFEMNAQDDMRYLLRLVRQKNNELETWKDYYSDGE